MAAICAQSHISWSGRL